MIDIIQTFRNQFTSVSYIVVLFLLTQGCCSIPLVDCGPKIAPIQVQPESVLLHNNGAVSIEFAGWEYKPRYKDTGSHLLSVECKVLQSDKYSVKLADSNIYYYKDSVRTSINDLVFLEEKFKKDKEIILYTFEIEDIGIEDFPLTIYFNKIPIINRTESDTSLHDLKLKVVK